MENQEVTLIKEKKSRKNAYQSLDKWMMRMEIAFGNATLPDIYPTLLTVGYDEVKIESLKGKLTQLSSLDQEQNKARAEQLAATEVSDKKRKEINGLYLKHRGLLKILLGENTLASASLKLNGQRKKSYSEWFQDVTSFYTQLSQSAELSAHAATVGITQAVIDSQKQLLTDLQTLKETQRKQKATMRMATDLRNKAFDELRPLYAEYIKYARILLAGNQILEAIGIKVKSR